MEYYRILNIADEDESLFLWGPRQVGKSCYLKKMFPEAILYDLLRNNEYARLSRRPSLLREELEKFDESALVIIDEIQKIPELLDEVHWLIVNRNIRFILCGSSARKLKRLGTNLLGGRAMKRRMFPLVSAEIPNFDIIKAVNNGMIPRHYLVNNPYDRLEAYIGVYLEEEIRMEANLRNIPTFNRFLEIAAQCDGEIINYSNIAQDCGVSGVTVKEYFNILEQTLIGYIIPAFTKSKKRRAITAPKFYYFDIGIVNYLLNRKSLLPGSADFGHAFEHLVIQELIAYIGYNRNRHSLSYWRSANGYEVDAIIGNAQIAIEIKSTREVKSNDTKGLKAFLEDFPDCRPIIVSLDERPRNLNGIEIIPVSCFFEMLWKDEILKQS